MATISFPPGKGSIDVEVQPNKLSTGVVSPGVKYMNAAYEVLWAIQQSLCDYGELPKVEDVAYHLKDLMEKK